jgi:putative nucleotidyltransferase with HDIG domain
MKMVDKETNILIVDDEELIRRPLRKMLIKEGYSCKEAGNAEEALEILRSNPAELIILDIKMPGKSGTELLPEIIESYPETAVIMATAVTETDTIIQCMKEGAQDYIPKPFDLDEVMLSVDRALHVRGLELEIKEYQQHLEQMVEEKTMETRQVFLGAIEALVFALETKDKYTAGHSRRVSSIALSIGKELGLSPDEMEDLQWGALLHDVGKIAIDPAIQNKRGKLTPEEYEHVMSHARLGPGIVKSVTNERVIEMIRHHHDRYDGTGLGQTVQGEDIPLGARIIALADAFDATTSERPYRSIMSVDEALVEIERCSGSQFAPEIVTAFLKIPLLCLR